VQAGGCHVGATEAEEAAPDCDTWGGWDCAGGALAQKWKLLY
jgi:hypothetical protein